MNTFSNYCSQCSRIRGYLCTLAAILVAAAIASGLVSFLSKSQIATSMINDLSIDRKKNKLKCNIFYPNFLYFSKSKRVKI
jgi:hypothetical protein